MSLLCTVHDTYILLLTYYLHFDVIFFHFTICYYFICFFFFSSRRRHTIFDCDWSSDVCSSDLSCRTHNRSCATPCAPTGAAAHAVFHAIAVELRRSHARLGQPGVELTAMVHLVLDHRHEKAPASHGPALQITPRRCQLGVGQRGQVCHLFLVDASQELARGRVVQRRSGLEVRRPAIVDDLGHVEALGAGQVANDLAARELARPRRPVDQVRSHPVHHRPRAAANGLEVTNEVGHRRDHSLDRHRPSSDLGGGAVLDADDGVVQPLGQLTDPAAVDDDAVALEGELTHRRDDGGGAGAPDLLQRSLAGRLADLVDRHRALGHAELPLAHEGQDGVAGDAGQDGAGERRRDDLVTDLQHDVHGADFFDVLAMHAVEPEHLGEALVLGLFGRVQAGRVVGRGLGLAQAAHHGAHVLVDDLDLHRVHAFRVIGPDRRDDDEVEILLGRPHAEERLAGDDGRTHVERRPHARRRPVAIDVDQRRPGLQHHLGIERRNAHALGRPVQALDVLLGTEEADLAVATAERLEALEQALAVVQHGRGWIHRERTVGLDARVVPALLLLEVHHEHVVGEDVAEGEVLVLWLLLLRGRARNPASVVIASPLTSSRRWTASEDDRLAIEPETLTVHVGNLPEAHIVLHRVDEDRHHVPAVAAGVRQLLEPAPDPGGITPRL